MTTIKADTEKKMSDGLDVKTIKRITTEKKEFDNPALERVVLYIALASVIVIDFIVVMTLIRSL